jgi:hypothetical protein
MKNWYSRHYTGEKRISLVVVFDHVDQRFCDVQFGDFEAARRFKELIRARSLSSIAGTQHLKRIARNRRFVNAVNF